MAKKTITTGLSSKNGQKVLLKKALKGELNEAQLKELTINNQEAEIYFSPSQCDSFSHMTAKVSAIISKNDQELESLHKKEQDELIDNIEKLHVLFDHYGIDPNDPNKYMTLSIELARALYPKPAKRGRKNKWSPEIETILVIEMERLIGQKKTITNAAKILSEKAAWREFIEAHSSSDSNPNPIEVLRTQYTNCQKESYIKENRPQFEKMEQTALDGWKKLLMRKRANN